MGRWTVYSGTVDGERWDGGRCFWNTPPRIGYLNINSLRNKITDLRELVQNFSPDYFVVAETKLYCSFPNAQFLLENYEIRNRKDRNSHGGGLLEYVRKGIICKEIDQSELQSCS